MYQSSHPYVLQQLIDFREGELARASRRPPFDALHSEARRRRLWILPGRQSRVRTVLNETIQLRGA